MRKLPNGLIIVDKPRQMTSHDVVAVIRRCLPKKTKVGHTGTLDPDATGVLPICVGKATRLAEYFSPLTKTYLGEMVLGAETSTQDSSGRVLRRASAAELAAVTPMAVKQAAEEFLGEIRQIPPMVSAVKINGKKLYQLAREGQVVERQPRCVTIYELEITEMDLPRVCLRVICSGGTYIRTLMHDIGQKLGVGAHLTALERQAVGEFDLSQALSLEQVKTMLTARDYSCLLPLGAGLEYLPALSLTQEKQLEAVCHGRPLTLTTAPAGTYRVLYDGALVAMGEIAPGSRHLKMKKVLFETEPQCYAEQE